MRIFVLMQKFTIDRRRTGLFTKQQNLLAYDQKQFRPFIEKEFSAEHISSQLDTKSKWFKDNKRILIHEVITEQYAKIDKTEALAQNIELIKDPHTFTITTGHQLSLFTGPVFFIYKILHTVKLCDELKKRQPRHHFVPIFWMASEDHDLQEICELEIFGKKLTWQTIQEGAVGRMDTKGLDILKSDLRLMFKSDDLEEIDALMNVYNGANLAQATLSLLNKLFGQFGLVCLNADHPKLKKAFIPVLEKELKTQFSHKAVTSTNKLLLEKEFKIQVKSNEINLFYIHESKREKILFENPGFFIGEEGLHSEAELLDLLHSYPERFSPNVVLRPLYQEFILPNICYVGGVGELTYWLQLKGVFDDVGVPFPLLQVRTSILHIDAHMLKKMNKSEISSVDLFEDKEDLKRKKLKERASEAIDFELLDARANQLSAEISKRVMSVDPGLEKYAGAEITRLQSQIKAIEEKLIKVMKQRHEDQLNAIDVIFGRLFPNGMMQERVLNVFGMCPDGKINDRIHSLYDAIDPWDPDLVILTD